MDEEEMAIAVMGFSGMNKEGGVTAYSNVSCQATCTSDLQGEIIVPIMFCTMFSSSCEASVQVDLPLLSSLKLEKKPPKSQSSSDSRNMSCPSCKASIQVDLPLRTNSITNVSSEPSSLPSSKLQNTSVIPPKSQSSVASHTMSFPVKVGLPLRNSRITRVTAIPSSSLRLLPSPNVQNTSVIPQNVSNAPKSKSSNAKPSSSSSLPLHPSPRPQITSIISRSFSFAPKSESSSASRGTPIVRVVGKGTIPNSCTRKIELFPSSFPSSPPNPTRSITKGIIQYKAQPEIRPQKNAMQEKEQPDTSQKKIIQVRGEESINSQTKKRKKDQPLQQLQEKTDPYENTKTVRVVQVKKRRKIHILRGITEPYKEITTSSPGEDKIRNTSSYSLQDNTQPLDRVEQVDEDSSGNDDDGDIGSPHQDNDYILQDDNNTEPQDTHKVGQVDDSSVSDDKGNGGEESSKQKQRDYRQEVSSMLLSDGKDSTHQNLDNSDFNAEEYNDAFWKEIKEYTKQKRTYLSAFRNNFPKIINRKRGKRRATVPKKGDIRSEKVPRLGVDAGDKGNDGDDDDDWIIDDGEEEEDDMEDINLAFKREFMERRLPRGTKEKNFMCDLCGKCYSKHYLLRNHAVKVHQELGKEMFPHVCQYCNSVFVSERCLSLHLKRPKGPCRVCGSMFECSGLLFSHRLARHDCMCPDCGKELKSKASLMHHMTVHKKPRVPCPDCGKIFLSVLRLNRHRAKEHGP